MLSRYGFLLGVFLLGSRGFSSDLLFKNAKWLDIEKQRIIATDFLIIGGKIRPMSEKPSQIETVDLAGKWVLPGLIDMHVHSWGNPFPNGKDETFGHRKA